MRLPVPALFHTLAALLLAVLATVAAAQSPALPEAPAPRVSLLTFAPGAVYWQRFGHNALLVEPADGTPSAVYNYGIFDFFQKNFFLNFARGHMQYRLAVIPVPDTLAEYAAEGRWVIRQDLALDDAQARALADALADNALPGQAEYRYDYFRANCSTRVRDALDRALGGQLQAQLQRPAPGAPSFRSEAVRLMSPILPLAVGMDALLGPAADPPLSAWEQAYVPEVLMQAVRTTRIDGRPLVAQEAYWLPPAGGPEAPARAPDFTLPFALAGLALAGLLLPGLSRPRGALALGGRAAAVTLSLLAGLGGLVLLAAWTLTEHWAMAANHNLLLFSPLSLLLVPALSRRGPPGRVGRITATLLTAGAVLALALQLLPGTQMQLHWILFWLPVHLAIAAALHRRPAATGPNPD